MGEEKRKKNGSEKRVRPDILFAGISWRLLHCAKLRSRSVFWRCYAATPVDIQLGRPADGGAATGSGNSRQLVFDICLFDVKAVHVAHSWHGCATVATIKFCIEPCQKPYWIQKAEML